VSGLSHAVREGCTSEVSRLLLPIPPAAVPHAVGGTSITDIDGGHAAFAIAADGISGGGRCAAAAAFVTRVPSPVAHLVSRGHDVGDALGGGSA